MQLLIENAERLASISLHTGAMTDRQFEALYDRYPDFRVELSSDGEVIIMPPVAPDTSHKNCRIARFLDEWAEMDGRGVAFESSAYFYLPTGARFSPDASWVANSRIPTRSGRPWPICPDFVIELRSASDRMPRLKRKMEEWIEGGALLAWLIDPKSKTVTIYRPGVEPEVLLTCAVVKGEGPVTGFELKLESIW